MMAQKKEKGFYEQCSPERCDELASYVRRNFDREAHREGGKIQLPERRRKGGVSMRVLEPAQIRAIGWARRYTLGEKRGLPLEFRRCFEFAYVNKLTHKHETPTCTEVAVYSVPWKTIDCYRKVSSVLASLQPRMGRPRKRESVNTAILALAGCSAKVSRADGVKRVTWETLTPSIAQAITGLELRGVRSGFNNAVAQGKLVCTKKVKGEPAKRLLRTLNEKRCYMPKEYATAFDDFLKSESEERVRSGFKRVFGGIVPASLAPEIPRIAKREFRGGAEIIRKGTFEMPMGFELGTTAKMREAREAEEWKRRFPMIARPSFGGEIQRIRRPVKIPHLPPRGDEWRGGGAEAEGREEEKREAEQFERSVLGSEAL